MIYIFLFLCIIGKFWFSCFFALLVSSDLMQDIVGFILLSTGYTCIPINILSFVLEHSEITWKHPFESYFWALLGKSRAEFSQGLILPYNCSNTLLDTLLNNLLITRFSILTGVTTNCSQPCMSSEHSAFCYCQAVLYLASLHTHADCIQLKMQALQIFRALSLYSSLHSSTLPCELSRLHSRMPAVTHELMEFSSLCLDSPTLLCGLHALSRSNMAQS